MKDTGQLDEARCGLRWRAQGGSIENQAIQGHLPCVLAFRQRFSGQARWRFELTGGRSHSSTASVTTNAIAARLLIGRGWGWNNKIPVNQLRVRHGRVEILAGHLVVKNPNADFS